MNLWECIICVGVLVFVVPFVTLAERNSLAALERAQEMDGARIALASAIDIALDGKTIPDTMEEEGIEYAIRSTTTTNFETGCPTAARIAIERAGSSQLLGTVEVPACEVGFLTD